MAETDFPLSGVRFVKRIVIGNQDPSRMASDGEIEKAMELLNRCLTEMPRGVIIGVEKGFSLLNIGEHQVVLQHTVYQVGFQRKPLWLE